MVRGPPSSSHTELRWCEADCVILNHTKMQRKVVEAGVLRRSRERCHIVRSTASLQHTSCIGGRYARRSDEHGYSGTTREESAPRYSTVVNMLREDWESTVTRHTQLPVTHTNCSTAPTPTTAHNTHDLSKFAVKHTDLRVIRTALRTKREPQRSSRCGYYRPPGGLYCAYCAA
jgi:hypothetical protein